MGLALLSVRARSQERNQRPRIFKTRQNSLLRDVDRTESDGLAFARRLPRVTTGMLSAPVSELQIAVLLTRCDVNRFEFPAEAAQFGGVHAVAAD